MQTIGELFMNPQMVQLIERSKKPPRHYLRDPEAPNKVYDQARFKLQVWFKDRNRAPEDNETRTFYSADWIRQPSGLYLRDEWNGLMKLQRAIEHRWKDKIKTAVCYAHTGFVPIWTENNFDIVVMKFNCWTGVTWNDKNNFELLNDGHHFRLKKSRPAESELQTVPERI